jgi:hypothetical protein
MRKLKKEKLSQLVHPKDRKVDQLQRGLRRQVRLEQQQEKRQRAIDVKANRFFWFREQCGQLLADRKVWTDKEAEALTHCYVHRNDQEIAQLKSLSTPPRGRIRVLEALLDHEEDQFKSQKGIEIPEITSEEGVEILVNVWDGDRDLIACVPVVRAVRGGVPVGTLDHLKSLLKPIEDVREAQANSSTAMTRQARKFTSEGSSFKTATRDTERDTGLRRKSVKAVPSAGETAARGKERRVLQQQQRVKVRRQHAIAMSRGLI